MQAQVKQLSISNESFKANKYIIENLRNALYREVPSLIREFQLNKQEQTALNEFVEDKCTLFRSLRRNSFSLPTTLSLLLDTIRWRLCQHVDAITLPSIADLLNSPFVYFHKFDKLNRPILLIHLEHLPPIEGLEKNDISIKSLETIAIFVLETARLLIWDLTKSRLNESVQMIANPVILDMVVLVDFKNASSVPVTNGSLIKTLIAALKRFPDLIDRIYFVNFRWVYQGMWQIFKPLLSEEAKSKIHFPKLSDLQNFIDKDNIIKGTADQNVKYIMVYCNKLGGKDDFQWNLHVDKYYTKYRAPLFNVDSSPILSRRNSTSTIYYDTLQILQTPNVNNTMQYQLSRSTSSVSLYATPVSSLSPVSSHTDLATLATFYFSVPTVINKSTILRTVIKRLFKLIAISSAMTEVKEPNETGLSPSSSVKLILREYTNKLNGLLPAGSSRIPPKSSTPPVFSSNKKNAVISWFLTFLRKYSTHIMNVLVKARARLSRHRRTVFLIIAGILFQHGIQEICQRIMLLFSHSATEKHNYETRYGWITKNALCIFLEKMEKKYHTLLCMSW
ncbi:hypothetical protein BDF20DRAFT_942828 [Mycotypha africana]|uniref:uncharacterized protein n=1 Tax=Mycotypha africana TaxID=64632 RepID=UPI0023005426|nr:uncharacterized protein BDF20DRAFT_942828 [Mycotypha africana]KAI8977675.1 hypothetical protein BDF20DRAFT_942828 [Mycotypha africana]